MALDPRSPGYGQTIALPGAWTAAAASESGLLASVRVRMPFAGHLLAYCAVQLAWTVYNSGNWNTTQNTQFSVPKYCILFMEGHIHLLRRKYWSIGNHRGVDKFPAL